MIRSLCRIFDTVQKIAYAFGTGGTGAYHDPAHQQSCNQQHADLLQIAASQEK